MLFFSYAYFSYEVRSDSRQETREQSRPQTRPVTTPENIRETDERRETDETKYETKYTRGGDRTICICHAPKLQRPTAQETPADPIALAAATACSEHVFLELCGLHPLLVS